MVDVAEDGLTSAALAAAASATDAAASLGTAASSRELYAAGIASSMDSLRTPKLVHELLLQARTSYPRPLALGLLLIQMKRFCTEHPICPKTSSSDPSQKLLMTWVLRFLLSFVTNAFPATILVDVVLFNRTPLVLANFDLLAIWFVYFILFHHEALFIRGVEGGGNFYSKSGGAAAADVASAAASPLGASPPATSTASSTSGAASSCCRFCFRGVLRVLTSLPVQAVAKTVFLVDLTRVSFNVLEKAEAVGLEHAAVTASTALMIWASFLFAGAPMILKKVFWDKPLPTIPIANTAPPARPPPTPTPAAATTTSAAQPHEPALVVFLKTNGFPVWQLGGLLWYYTFVLRHRCGDEPIRTLGTCLKLAGAGGHPYVECVLIVGAVGCALDLFLYSWELLDQGSTAGVGGSQRFASRELRLVGSNTRPTAEAEVEEKKTN
eukprot:g10483.t1